jgi:hypothetical protein
LQTNKNIIYINKNLIYSLQLLNQQLITFFNRCRAPTNVKYYDIILRKIEKNYWTINVILNLEQNILQIINCYIVIHLKI